MAFNNLGVNDLSPNLTCSGDKKITLSGDLTTIGAYDATFTLSNTTTLTFPTTGILATTAQLPSFPVSVTNGGTGLSSTTINQILYSSAANTISQITAAASSVLITSAANVPSLSQTLPSAVQSNITALGTIASLFVSSSGQIVKRTPVVAPAVANYIVLSTDYIIAVTGVIPVTDIIITLPTPSVANNGQVFIVKDESGTATGPTRINVVVAGGAFIDGSATRAITSAFSSVTVYSNGAKYFVI